MDVATLREGGISQPISEQAEYMEVDRVSSIAKLDGPGLTSDLSQPITTLDNVEEEGH